MLTHGDDYPLHQTPDPIAFAGTDRNFYDRYFFNGLSPDGETFFAIAFGVYPQLNVADAHVCFVRDGVQHCLHASRLLDMERMALEVGPIRIQVLEPLRRLRVTVAPTDGLAAQLDFTGRAFPIEEPRFTRRTGPRAFMDYTRMTQNGRYKGWIEVDGQRTALQPGTVGTRDRSWGIRPVGAPDAQPPVPAQPPQFFWQWTPINLPTRSLFFHINADGQGHPWNLRAAMASDGAGACEIIETVDARMLAPMTPGTRWPQHGILQAQFAGQAPLTASLTPVGRFQMRGLGYTSPTWAHGLYKGPLVVEREDIVLSQCEAGRSDHFHVQLPCRVTVTQGDVAEDGIGVFEQLVIGPYAPLGLTDVADLAPASA